ncbi:MAG TPA: DUF2946 family protein [Pirellulales bacterium]|jgi:hypothetical protein|nr:DUF2946 family protein [Pirellulales bacterium]
MKAGVGKIAVWLALIAYVALSGLGTGVHSLVHHEHALHVSLDHVSLDGATGTVLEAGEEHADDDDACPICHFQRLVQLSPSVDPAPRGVAVAPAPAIRHEAPQLSPVCLPYSPRGPPDRAACHA